MAYEVNRVIVEVDTNREGMSQFFAEFIDKSETDTLKYTGCVSVLINDGDEVELNLHIPGGVPGMRDDSDPLEVSVGLSPLQARSLASVLERYAEQVERERADA